MLTEKNVLKIYNLYRVAGGGCHGLGPITDIITIWPRDQNYLNPNLF